MIKVTVNADGFEARATYGDDAKLNDIKTKIISQMNNGHTIILGDSRDVLVNPEFVRTVEFEIVE